MFQMSTPIISVLYDILRLKVPAKWTEDFASTLETTPAETYRRRPAKQTVSSLNMIDNYLSIILIALMDADLPTVLVQLITTTKVS